MSGAVMNAVGKKMAKKHLAKHFSSEKLYFEEIETQDWRGRTKIKKIKKPLPEGLTKEEAALLKKVKKRAYQLDMAFGNVLGTRLGWSAAVGLLPGAGDFADSALALLLLREIRKIQPPLNEAQQGRMLLNILVQFAIGVIPLLGDYMDGVYKANSRNVAILEHELIKRVQERSGHSPNDKRLNDRRGGAPGIPMDESRAGPSSRRDLTSQNLRSDSRRRWWSRPEHEVESKKEVPPPMPPRKDPQMNHRHQY